MPLPPRQSTVSHQLHLLLTAAASCTDLMALYSSWPAVSRMSNKHVSPSMTTYTKRHQKIHKNKLYAVNIPGRETSLLIQELGSSVQGTVHSKIEFKIYWFRKIYVEPCCLRCVLRCNYGNGETEGIRTGNVWCRRLKWKKCSTKYLL